MSKVVVASRKLRKQTQIEPVFGKKILIKEKANPNTVLQYLSRLPQGMFLCSMLSTYSIFVTEMFQQGGIWRNRLYIHGFDSHYRLAWERLGGSSVFMRAPGFCQRRFWIRCKHGARNGVCWFRCQIIAVKYMNSGIFFNFKYDTTETICCLNLRTGFSFANPRVWILPQ